MSYADQAAAREMRARLGRLAWLLDSSIRIPGTRFRIGLDALIGLFPVLGDLLGVLLSSYIVISAARLGAPKAVLLRMVLNLGVEGLIGAIPLAGDVFDAAWKANQRNVRLLDTWLERPRRAKHASRLFALLLILTIVTLVALLTLAVFFLARWLFGGA